MFTFSFASDDGLWVISCRLCVPFFNIFSCMFLAGDNGLMIKHATGENRTKLENKMWGNEIKDLIIY